MPGSDIYYDETTKSVMITDYAHHEIHEGRGFIASYAADIANAASVNILVTTPNTSRYTHVIVNVISEAEAQFILYEDVTATTAGTSIPAINRNRNSANVAGTTVAHTPDGWAVDAATVLQTKHWGSGKTTGADVRGESEFILKPNTKYGIVVTNGTTSNNYTTVWLDWYEYINKGS